MNAEHQGKISRHGHCIGSSTSDPHHLPPVTVKANHDQNILTPLQNFNLQQNSSYCNSRTPIENLEWLIKYSKLCNIHFAGAQKHSSSKTPLKKEAQCTKWIKSWWHQRRLNGGWVTSYAWRANSRHGHVIDPQHIRLSASATSMKKANHETWLNLFKTVTTTKLYNLQSNTNRRLATWLISRHLHVNIANYATSTSDAATPLHVRNLNKLRYKNTSPQLLSPPHGAVERASD